MLYHHRIHITPKDYLIRIPEEFGGKRCHIDYFIEPYGEHQHNEMSDTVYDDGNSSIGYHEHTRGVETFMVDGGSVEVEIRGRRAIATRGDIIQVSSFMPHKFRWIEDGTIWRELFQETQMVEDMMAQARYKEFHPETFDMSINGQGTDSYWHSFEPVTVEVPKEEIPEIRPYNGGLSIFKFKGCELRQKVGRWETKGHKEVWQLCLEPGFRLSWSEKNPFYNLFIVQEGSVEVKLDGMDPFVANERDILHIPNYLAGEIVTKGNVVLFDYNCEGWLYRAMEELYALQVREPERLEAEAEAILRKNQCYIHGEPKK